MIRTATRTVFATLAVLAAVLAFTSGPAAAHNSLASSTPTNGATLDVAPTSVTLTFQEKLDPGTQLTVTGPSGTPAGGAITITDATVSTPFTAGLAGEYIIMYRTVSEDGDAVNGSVLFTLTAAAVPSPAPVVAVPAVSPSTPPVSDAAATTSSNKGSWVWVAGALAVGVITGATTVYLQRRRRMDA